MTRHPFAWAFLLPLALLSAVLRAAEPADDGAARLREALRASLLQLRTAQADLATAQSAQAGLAAENQDLKSRAAIRRREEALDHGTAEKAVAALRAAAAAQALELDRARRESQTWEGTAKQAAALAAAREAERARLAAEALEQQRRIELREAQNRELFRLANEILTRYEKFSLGEALAAREPFVGAIRTRLENQVQGYADRLSAQKARP